jgi:hypothetical protein
MATSRGFAEGKVRRLDGLKGGPEGPALAYRINALPNLLMRFPRRVAGHLQGDSGKSAQANVAPFESDCDAKNPALRTSWRNREIQTFDAADTVHADAGKPPNLDRR